MRCPKHDIEMYTVNEGLRVDWICEQCEKDREAYVRECNINPNHYRSHPSGIECIQITEHMDFCLGNVIKYVWRCGLKGYGEQELEDLKKARWYLDRAISQREGL